MIAKAVRMSDRRHVTPPLSHNEADLQLPPQYIIATRDPNANIIV